MSTPKDQLKKGIESNLSPETPHNATGSPAQRTFGQSWLAIPRKTRLVLSCILFGTAVGGLYISNKLEDTLPADQTRITQKPKSSSS